MTYYKGLGEVQKGRGCVHVKVLSNKHPTQLGKNTLNLSPNTGNPKNNYETAIQLQPLDNYKHKYTTWMPMCVRTTLLTFKNRASYI